MARKFALAVALPCALALSLSACQLPEPTLQPGALSPGALAEAGIPSATATKIADRVAQVQTVASQICAIVPTAETIANLALAQSDVRSTVQGLAKLACRALAKPLTYAALGSEGSPSHTITGVALVGGHVVTVRGTRVR